jgi:hypothetical protein
MARRQTETTYLSGLAGLALALATAVCWTAFLGYAAIKLLWGRGWGANPARRFPESLPRETSAVRDAATGRASLVAAGSHRGENNGCRAGSPRCTRPCRSGPRWHSEQHQRRF